MNATQNLRLITDEAFERLPVLLSRGELCALTGLSPDTINRLRDGGVLPAIRPADGMRYRYHKQAVKILEERLNLQDSGDSGSEKGRRE